jgi:hypothetical protein
MPRWASRITLEIINVKIERLQEITEDVKSEGVEIDGHYTMFYKTAFERFWDPLYAKKPEYQWAANPWVWVIEFRKWDDTF